ncbi:conserved hypothetical protein [Rubrivivax sp. A210]|uniref:hypothetical protein n=1 Tax=Rubrivivax sp. A210 TaxID=2772301 RepID=UPI00191A26C1|nr:hypothetical protein [Rubrivivax sp. A210]CAD5366683.1 conserved hypothetical protein [Rubrivivax sp. A210]
MSTMTGHELCEAVEQHLGTLGYRVFGEPCEGWDWELGGYQSPALACDSQGEAAAAALADLVKRTSELLDAAEAVIARWERGNLAAAVRELELSVTALRKPNGDLARDATPSISADEVAPEGWLLHGEGPDGPWTEAVFLDLAAATGSAMEFAREWIEEGLEIDLDHYEGQLAEHKFIHMPALNRTVWIDAVDVIGA